MTFQEFCETIRQNMEDYVGDTAVVSLVDVRKNNGIILTGMNVRPVEESISPTIYLNEVFGRYEEGLEIPELMAELIQCYETRVNKIPDMSFFSDFEVMKKRIIFKLIHYGQNKELLDEIPHKRWNDLAIVFYYSFWHENIGTASVLIRNDHVRKWNTDVDTLYQYSMENTPKLQPEVLMSMTEVLQDLQGVEIPAVDFADVPMYILSNAEKNNGAAAVIYSEKMRALAEHLACNLYVIPSSIHEMILIPETDYEDPGFIRNMIREINETEVPLEIRLSDTLYYYNRATKLTSICG